MFVADASGNVAAVSRKGDKGDVYAMSIMSWEILSLEKAYSDIKSFKLQAHFYALFSSIHDQIREGQFDLFMSH
eukprot:gene25660-25817_t